MYAAMKYLGHVTGTTMSITGEILDALERATGKQLTHCWGKGGGSEHSTGRAVDFMVFNDRAAGDWIADYVWKNRARFNLTHIIWRQRIISTVVSPGKWRDMETRPGGRTANHFDHPHILFGATTYVPPGPRAPKLTTPRGPFPLLSGHYFGVADGTARAHNGAVVRDRQGILQIQTAVGADPDGQYGPITAGKVREYQKTHNMLVTGRVNATDWARM